jgi:hypothetical protein
MGGGNGLEDVFDSKMICETATKCSASHDEYLKGHDWYLNSYGGYLGSQNGYMKNHDRYLKKYDGYWRATTDM